MVHRSNVVIRIFGSKDVRTAFRVQLKLTFPKDDMPEDYGSMREDKRSTIFEYASVKWYDDYPFVEAWNKALLSLEERELIWAEFLRIGEDDNDVAYLYFGAIGYNRTLWVERIIHIE